MNASPNPALTILPPLDPLDPCKGCGACCRHMVSPPFWARSPAGTPDNDPDWERLLAERPDLAAGIEADYLRREAAGRILDDHEAPCLWLDEAAGRCRHYEHRPEICRDFTPDNLACWEARHRRGLATDADLALARATRPDDD